jgi:RNA polymerase sigma-70 factor (ECF subfamily)
MEKKEILSEYLINNQNKLYRIAFTYTKNQDNAKDILHDSILKAYKKINTLRDIERINYWFIRILVNCSINYLKRSKRIVLFEDGIELVDNDINVNYDDLYDAIDLLAPVDKSLITLKYFEQLTFKEISNIMSLNENTVKSKIYKSLKIMRKGINIDEYKI